MKILAERERSVSISVAARLKSGQTKLKPAEWKSGDRCWLVDLIAPFGGADGFVKMVSDGVLKDHRPSQSAMVQFTVRAAKAKRVVDVNEKSAAGEED